MTKEKRIFHEVTCKKCGKYLCGALEGTSVMCPNCNVWMTSGEEKKPEDIKKK